MEPINGLAPIFLAYETSESLSILNRRIKMEPVGGIEPSIVAYKATGMPFT
jgi:hypothetical protein